MCEICRKRGPGGGVYRGVISRAHVDITQSWPKIDGTGWHVKLPTYISEGAVRRSAKRWVALTVVG